LHYYTCLENYTKFMHVLSTVGIAAFRPIYYKYHTSVTLPHLTQLSAYLRTNYWHLDPSSRSGTTDMGRKLERGCALLGEAGSPSDTMSRGPRLRLPLYQVAS